MSYNEKRDAAAEALEAFKTASEERRRARILIYTTENSLLPVDITEDVVSLLDMLLQFMRFNLDVFGH